MHVLIATDGSKQSLAAARFLRSFTDAASIDKVSVLAVVRPLAAVPFATETSDSAAGGATWEDHSFRKAAAEATEIIAADLRNWAPDVSTHVWSGSPSSQIVKAAKQMNSGLIVVASRSSVAETVLMGSVAHRVLNYAPCPVLVVRPTKRATEQRKTSRR